MNNVKQLLGHRVAAFYPVSGHLCWHGVVVDAKDDKVCVRAEGFDHLSDWFHISNVSERPMLPPAHYVSHRH